MNSAPSSPGGALGAPLPSCGADRFNGGHHSEAEHSGYICHQEGGNIGQRFHHAVLGELWHSGAKWCVCPRDYAQECPIEPLLEHQVQLLLAVTVEPMKVYHYKCVTFPQGRWMVVRYLVCDIPHQVVSVAGLPFRLHGQLQLPQDAPIVEEPPSSGRHYGTRSALLGAEVAQRAALHSG